MPHKFNAARRHKFPKKRYRVTNCAEYTEILRRRGDLTIWVTDDTLKQWRAPRRTTPGGQPKYSNIAIETGSAPGRGVIPTLARAEWSLARSSGEVRAGCWAAMDVLR